MKRASWLLAGGAALLLAGCGQKGALYLPDKNAPNSLKGHRINDQLSSLISPPTTPAAVLDFTAQYVYDSLDI